MTRHEAREQAFIITFEKLFTNEPVKEIIEKSKQIRQIKENPYAFEVAIGIEEKLDEVDATFEKFLQNWNKERISNVSLCSLRVATYEYLFLKDIPVGAIIDEAVEITKKYSTKEDSAFVNGVLGKMSKEIER